jgi:hypothetical protein
MREWLKWWGILALGVALFGCVSTGPVRTVVQVQVSGYAREGYPAAAQKYVILPAEKGITADDLEFSEYARYVDYVLSKAGFQKASSPDVATLVVFLSYGIGNPEEHQYSVTLPVYGQTGVSSSTTTATVNTNGNWGTYTGTTTYTPSYGITGYRSVSGTYITYFRYIALSAVDLVQYRENQKIVEVWKTKMASVGYVGDLRRIFPAIIAASEQYIGRDTGMAVNTSIFETDPEVDNVRSVREQQGAVLPHSSSSPAPSATTGEGVSGFEIDVDHQYSSWSGTYYVSGQDQNGKSLREVHSVTDQGEPILRWVADNSSKWTLAIDISKGAVTVFALVADDMRGTNRRMIGEGLSGNSNSQTLYLDNPAPKSP